MAKVRSRKVKRCVSTASPSRCHSPERLLRISGVAFKFKRYT